MRVEPFLSVCDFQGGTQPPKTQFISEPRDGYVRLVQIRDFDSDQYATYIPDSRTLKKCESSDVLIARYGASIGRILRGKAGAYNVALVKTIPNLDLLREDYLYYWLTSKTFQQHLKIVSSRAAQAGFNKDDFRDLKIPLPSLNEQDYITDLLSRAEGIVRLRHEAEKKAAELIPALFLDMFGDPATNPKGWPVVPTGGLVKLINGRAFKPTEWSKAGTPIIRIQNLNDPSKPFNYYEGNLPEKFRVRSGDILLSWSGTPGTSFGCFRWLHEEGWLNQHIFRVDVSPDVNEEFFIHQINLRLPELIGRAHGGVGLQHFTKGELESLPFILPPLLEQQRFHERAEQALSIRSQQSGATDKAQATFDALLATAFSWPDTDMQGDEHGE